MTEFDPIRDTMGGQSYATAGENAMKDLCAATDPARFIELANEWCREHKEVKP